MRTVIGLTLAGTIGTIIACNLLDMLTTIQETLHAAGL